VSPDSFTMQTSILFLLIVLFGGLGRVTGPLVGSMVLIVLPELLHRFSDYRLVMYGVLLLGSIYFLPQGGVGALSTWRRSRTPYDRRAEGGILRPPSDSPFCAIRDRGSAIRVRRFFSADPCREKPRDEVRWTPRARRRRRHARAPERPRPDRSQRSREDDVAQHPLGLLPADGGDGDHWRARPG